MCWFELWYCVFVFRYCRVLGLLLWWFDFRRVVVCLFYDSDCFVGFDGMICLVIVGFLCLILLVIVLFVVVWWVVYWFDLLWWLVCLDWFGF